MRQSFSLAAIASRGASSVVLLALVVAAVIIGAIVPPLQSPDEADHIKRAYLLGKGDILLRNSANQGSGGAIDSGLLTYMASYAQPDRKVTADLEFSVAGLRWSGQRVFSPAAGTAYYFPLIYFPQAIGLAVGERLGWSVNASYRLAKFLALAASGALLTAAFILFPVSPAVMAVLLLPMSLFQFSTAALDGVSTALAIFVIAAFMKMAEERERTSPNLFFTFTLAIGLLATSRTHLLALFVLMPWVCKYIGKRPYALYAAACFVLVVGWVLVAMVTTVDRRVTTGAPASELVFFYLRHPESFVRVLWATVADRNRLLFYRDSFVLMLPLGARLSGWMYSAIAWCLAAIGLLSASPVRMVQNWRAGLALLLAAMSSTLLIFLALLVTWTHHPAAAIDGVQGRYFVVPLIMVLYATAGTVNRPDSVAQKLALTLLVGFGVLTMSATARLVVDRFYRGSQSQTVRQVSLKPTPPLEQNHAISLKMDHEQLTDPKVLKGVDVMFGTYARTNVGTAEIRLQARGGTAQSIRFDLSDLDDNGYRHFAVAPQAYESGEIVPVTGGGVSVWEARSENSVAATCMIYEYVDGSRRAVEGCPH